MTTVSASVLAKHVFIDESGSDDLDTKKSGVSDCYIVAGILVDSASSESVSSHFDSVRRDSFQGPEMSSRLIGGDDIRRLGVLRALLNTDFLLYFLVVRKDQLRSPGLGYSRSFVKFFFRMLLSEVLRNCDTATLISDHIKTSTFEDDVSCYLQNSFKQGLFSNWSLSFVDSRTTPGVQAADGFAGTVARVWEVTRRSKQSAEFLGLLRPRVLLYNVFPQPRDSVSAPPLFSPHTSDDVRIRARAIAAAEERINAIAESPDVKHAQETCVLQELLAFNHLERSDDWLPGDELRQRCSAVLDDVLSDRAFQNIVARLRDAGIPVSAKAEGGYKLATCHDDLLHFVNSQDAKVGPMLRRVRIVRDAVRRATDGAVDILSAGRYANLRTAVEATQTWEPKLDGDTHEVDTE
jgi:hypothetical protein